LVVAGRPKASVERSRRTVVCQSHGSSAIELGVARDGGEDQLSEEVIGQVVERVVRTGPTVTGKPGGACWQKRSGSGTGSNKT
jgi:hypothetical protein